jgi:hypothetical protein
VAAEAPVAEVAVAAEAPEAPAAEVVAAPEATPAPSAEAKIAVGVVIAWLHSNFAGEFLHSGLVALGIDAPASGNEAAMQVIGNEGLVGGDAIAS